ncbi:hypothetical protein GV827_17410 [Sulfitobacter sp. JBTF-M27]|uniref:B12-binding domain-containing protein n=1 Tax=Sulfitobacter sediminilitoris TaxID=2698830 RepID=A0A6P0CD94_9RHOB|nr:cobalamin B12-binding domain-containing protein [Sulfitobacter sediminilitoris]NEK24169.1 hypothetical protein [Sulfitobacter sediminilitoris]
MRQTQRTVRSQPHDGVSQVVLQALSTIAPSSGSDGAIRKPLESYLCQMFDSMLHASGTRLLDVVKDMRRARITSLSIAETYVPIIARRLGNAWLADTVNFAAVTIGSARLQALLHRLECDWGLSCDAKFDSPPAYLVGVPEGVQHTLGASVLAGQLRHRGLSVHLELELTAEQLAQQVRHERYSGVLISASSLDHLRLCNKLIECSKNESRNTPVIIGGIILEQHSDIQSQTQADLVTSDVYEALRHCDISAAVQEDVPAFHDPRVVRGQLVDDRRRAAE